MSGRFFGVLKVCLSVLVFASRAAAQGPAPAACNAVYWELNPSAAVLKAHAGGLNLTSLGTCIEALRVRVSKRADGPQTDQKVEGLLHKDLVDDYRAYRRLKLWYRSLVKGFEAQVKAGEIDRAVSTLRDEIYDKLAAHSLYLPFSGELVTGMSFVTAQNASSSFLNPAQSKDTAASAHLVFETRHFGDEDQKSLFDVSIAGRLGFQPALTLVQNTVAGTSTATGAAAGKYQDAFGWSTTFKVNAKIESLQAEMPVALTYGQYILTTDTVVVDQGTTRTIAIPVDNGTSDAQGFWEATVGMNLYGRSLHLVHAEKDFVSPLMSVVFGYKRDTRFKQPASATLIAFDSPEDRLVFRFFTAPFPVIMSNASSGKNVVGLSFGIEREWALKGSNTVPSGTRILLRGDVDLLKALRSTNQ